MKTRERKEIKNCINSNRTNQQRRKQKYKKKRNGIFHELVHGAGEHALSINIYAKELYSSSDKIVLLVDVSPTMSTMSREQAAPSISFIQFSILCVVCVAFSIRSICEQITEIKLDDARTISPPDFLRFPLLLKLSHYTWFSKRVCPVGRCAAVRCVLFMSVRPRYITLTTTIQTMMMSDKLSLRKMDNVDVR